MEQRGVLRCVETSGKHAEQGRDTSQEGVDGGRSEGSCPLESTDANLLELRSASRRKVRRGHFEGDQLSPTTFASLEEKNFNPVKEGYSERDLALPRWHQQELGTVKHSRMLPG